MKKFLDAIRFNSGIVLSRPGLTSTSFSGYGEGNSSKRSKETQGSKKNMKFILTLKEKMGKI